MEALARNTDYRTLCRFAILGLIFALNGCVYACIPIIFYRPQFYCPKEGAFDSNNNQIYEPCDEVAACTPGIVYRISADYPQINSISMEFNLYCNLKIVEAAMLTVMAAGQIFAFIIGTAVYIHPKNQYTYFIYGNTITGIALVLTYFINNPYLLIPTLFIWNTYYGLYMSIIFAHLNFFFSGALSKFGPSVYNTAWPVFMLLYCLFTYYYGYWKDSLVVFAGIPYLILTGLLIYFKPPPHRSAVKQPQQQIGHSHVSTHGHQKQYQPPTLPSSATQSLQNHKDSAKSFMLQEIPKQSNIISTQAPSQPTNATSTANASNNNSNNKKNIDINGNNRVLSKTIKKNALNQRLLDIDKHEIAIKAPAAATIHQKKMDEVVKTAEQNDIEVKPVVEASAWEDFKNQLKSIHQNEKYFKNVVLFILCWLGTNIAYFGCLLVMGDLGGDIYTNVAFSTVFEFIGNLSATFLIIKFPERKILRISFLIVGISYVSCLFFDPTNQEVANGYSFTIIMSLIPIIIAKGTHEMLWTVLQTYLNTILPPEFHQFSFASSNLVSVIVMDLLPFYKYLMEMIRFNQFFGYGLYCIFTYYIIQFFEDLYKEDGKPIVKDVIIPAGDGKYDIEMQIAKELSLAQDLLKTI